MFADIGFGILLSFFVSSVFHTELTSQFLLLGILFSLLPDFDFLIAFFSKKIRSIGAHRDIAHFPFLYLLIAVFVFIFAGKAIGLLFSLCIFLHFLHDSMGIGWGVKWFWPFSAKVYKVFSDQGGKFAFQVARWSDEEVKVVEEKEGDPNWIRNIYFHPTFISVTEFGIFFVGLVFIYFFWYK